MLVASMTATKHPLSHHISSAVLIVTLIILSVAQEVLIPISLAALFAVILTPIVKFLARYRVPDLVAVIGVVGLATITVTLTAWVIIGQVNEVAGHVSEYKDNLRHRMRELRNRGKGVTAVAETVTDLKTEIASALPNTEQSTIKGADKPLLVTIGNLHSLDFSDVIGMATSSLKPLGIAILTILLATFMMAQRMDLHRRFLVIISFMAGKGLPAISQLALDEVTRKITHYLVLQSLSNLAAGIIVTIALYSLGLPNALLWGLLTSLLRFVPYIGILLVATLAFVFAVAVSPGWNLPLLVAGMFFVVEMVIGNVIEPIFFAHGTGLSTLAVLVATAFWTWIWGPAGLIQAIPLTVCLVAVGKYVPSLNYLYILLAKDPADLKATVK